MDDARNAARAHGRELIGKVFSEFFDRCPKIEKVVWAQYAPHFNDGDACEFGVHEPDIYAFGVSNPEDDDYYEGEYHYGEHNDLDKQSAKVWQELELGKLFNYGACEQVMEFAFGSDAMVIATRDGFEITEYEHD